MKKHNNSPLQQWLMRKDFYNLLFVAQGFLNNITEICKHNMMDTEIKKYYITSELLNIRFDDMLLLLGSPSRIGQRRRSCSSGNKVLRFRLSFLE